jgi:hypothetical protein
MYNNLAFVPCIVIGLCLKLDLRDLDTIITQHGTKEIIVLII